MLSLASLLSIPALSRVQVLSRRTMADASVNSPGVLELPFWFFQCVVGDQLELRSPGGYMARVNFDEVCDMIPAQPLIVQAMPRATSTQRNRLPIVQRQAAPSPDLFKPAQVMWVTKDRWSRVDSVYVRFLDERLNEGETPTAATITDECRADLNRTASRERMPVSNRKTAANCCALSREPADRKLAKRSIERFMQAALIGAPATSFLA